MLNFCAQCVNQNADGFFFSSHFVHKQTHTERDSLSHKLTIKFHHNEEICFKCMHTMIFSTTTTTKNILGRKYESYQSVIKMCNKKKMTSLNDDPNNNKHVILILLSFSSFLSLIQAYKNFIHTKGKFLG